MLSNFFKPNLITHASTERAVKDTPKALEDLRHSEGIRRALRGHPGTWRALGHLDGTRRALGHLRHLGT